MQVTGTLLWCLRQPSRTYHLVCISPFFVGFIMALQKYKKNLGLGVIKVFKNFVCL